MADFYGLLGCNENSSYEEIKRSYQDLVRKSHPDKISAVHDDNSEHFIKITEAWQTLRDPAKRKAYDALKLAEQCESEHVLHATLVWSDLNNEGNVHSYPCRCGSLYMVSKDDCANALTDLYLQCSECSLGILIKADEAAS